MLKVTVLSFLTLKVAVPLGLGEMNCGGTPTGKVQGGGGPMPGGWLGGGGGGKQVMVIVPWFDPLPAQALWQISIRTARERKITRDRFLISVSPFKVNARSGVLHARTRGNAGARRRRHECAADQRASQWTASGL